MNINTGGLGYGHGGYVPVGIEAVGRAGGDARPPADLVENIVFRHGGHGVDVVPAEPTTLQTSVETYWNEMQRLLDNLLALTTVRVHRLKFILKILILPYRWHSIFLPNSSTKATALTRPHVTYVLHTIQPTTPHPCKANFVMGPTLTTLDSRFYGKMTVLGLLRYENTFWSVKGESLIFYFG